ncbi:hypothetical protein [Hymenobacter actinosclerus]|uniref:hypothetical protein n=1 Tax=Hymenobacter actinosclerus TaxID=82805 RepID=UPI001FDF3180|nr:hypothetical protein [Hymenobacter actinosclerus]
MSSGATQKDLVKFGANTQPVELASIYVQLADSQASYATGQVYGAMGGNGTP